MTGSEKSGLAHSQAHLFENSYYVITPTSKSEEKNIQAYKDLAVSLGALPIVLDCRQHDFITAAVSHLPHVIAAALVNTVHDLDTPQEYMKLIAAGGFKDITRIASSSPEMWEQICLENAGNISQIMDTFLELMESVQNRHARKSGDRSLPVVPAFQGISRLVFFLAPWLHQENVSDLLRYSGESGAIATIATILAVNNISIKNIGIVHNREFEEGALRIEFYEESPSLKAAQVLRQHRYQVGFVKQKGRSRIFYDLEKIERAFGRTDGSRRQVHFPPDRHAGSFSGGSYRGGRVPSRSGLSFYHLLLPPDGRPDSSGGRPDSYPRCRPSRPEGAGKDFGCRKQRNNGAPSVRNPCRAEFFQPDYRRRFDPKASYETNYRASVPDGGIRFFRKRERMRSSGNSWILPSWNPLPYSCGFRPGKVLYPVGRYVWPECNQRNRTGFVQRSYGADAAFYGSVSLQRRTNRFHPAGAQTERKKDPDSRRYFFAAYFIAAGLLVPNSEILLKNVGINPTRSGMLNVCRDMGADLTLLNEDTSGPEPVADLLVKSSSLHGTVIEGDLIPALIDELPILAVLAAFAQGTTRSGTRRS